MVVRLKHLQGGGKQRKEQQYLITPSTSPKNRAIAMAAGLVIPGSGFLYKKAIDTNTIFAPKKKKTKPIQPIDNRNDEQRSPSKTYNQWNKYTHVRQILLDPFPIKPKDNFFNFVAYNSGGVSSGPPPKRGPNPQVPPVKMKGKGQKNE